jgi:hypothetical protein
LLFAAKNLIVVAKIAVTIAPGAARSPCIACHRSPSRDADAAMAWGVGGGTGREVRRKLKTCGTRRVIV